LPVVAKFGSSEPFGPFAGITSVTDAEAMAALARGEIQALDFLVPRHNDRAQRLAYGVLRDSSRTHDVVADSFLAIVASAQRFDPTRPFAPWFDRIVINRAIKEAQRDLRHGRISAILRRPIEENDPSRIAEASELRESLVLAFARLHPRDRAVVTMRLVLGMSEQETAAALGCPAGTVKSRLARARRHLHRHLGEAGIVSASTTPLGDKR
jgi:RNA polymerase sigma-70 factor (ECF subfamily)